MKNANYEKPTMNIVNLRSKQSIAADSPCMSQASKGNQTFYYDIPGNGWLVIKTAKNCNGVVTSMDYEQNPDLVGKVDPISPSVVSDYELKAYAAINRNKQDFVGAVYGEPDPKWS